MSAEINSGKLAHEEWVEIEQRFSDSDKAVMDSLRNFVNTILVGLQQIVSTSTTTSQQIGKHKVIGLKYYLKLRPLLVAKGLVDEAWLSKEQPEDDDTPTKKQPKVQKKKVGQTATEIREAQTAIKLSNALTAAISQFGDRQLTPGDILKSEFFEFVGVGFIYMLHWLLSHTSEPLVRLAVITSTQRFMKVCETYRGMLYETPDKYSAPASQLLLDLQLKYKKETTKHSFDGLTIQKETPQFFIESPYDSVIPSYGATPRRSQMDILNFVYNNFVRGFIAIYAAMIGSGKTSSVVGIADIVRYIRANPVGGADSQLELLFVCNVRPVRLQVARICYNMDIGFGIATINSKNKLVVVNSNMSKKGSSRLVTIATTAAARELLEDPNSYTKYLLFHDEPNIDADQPDSWSLNENCSVIARMPKWTILSSATMCDIETIPAFKAKILKQNPDVVIQRIVSSEVQIGCDIRTFDGMLVNPWRGCQSTADLKLLLSNIRDTPFFGKILTSNTAIELWTLGQRHGVQFKDIRELLKDVSNGTPTRIREIVLDMLTTLSETTDELVATICDGLMDTVEHHALNINRIGTTDAWKSTGMTLVATMNPFEDALEMFDDLLKDLSKAGVKIGDMITAYKQELTAYEAK